MTRKLVFSSIMALAFSGLAPRSYAATVPVVSADEDASYAAGTQAMNERRWSDAIVSFDQVINGKGKKADAALYWKAYALNKLDKQDLAADTCTQLRTQFKDSAWNEDCRALSLTIRVRTRASDRADANGVQVIDLRGMDPGGKKDPETEIKLLALNAVMRENPTQGIPLMRGILTGDQPLAVKQQALFILAQNHSPEAQAMMHDLIVGKMGPELQYKAIQDSGIYRGKRNNQGKDSSDELLEAYHASSDVKVKRAVISALFISGDDARLVDLARQEKDLELKRTIVSQLSLMKGKAASDYMMELLK